MRLIIIIISTAVVMTSCTDKKNEEVQKPNVLLILADDLGYGDISCYGQNNYQTPNIDNIALHGVHLTDFYVPTPYCAPSRGTLMTGRFPLRHGLVKNPHPDGSEEADTLGLSLDEITMAEVFKEAGYATKAIGKWHLGHKEKFFPVNQGFDEYYGILYSNDMLPVQIIQNKDTAVYPVDQRFLTKDYTEKAIDFIERKKDQPFFLYLAHAMPHKPLAASDNFYTPDTPDDLYADVLRELDWSVGEVINALKKLKLLENTIVIFMSDNGPWYGGSTGGLKGMKATTWEGGIRVPFMISYKKVFPENQEINVPTWSPDIFPTIFSLTNIIPSKSHKLDGQDITEILKGNSTDHPPVFSMHNYNIMSVRKGDYKLFVKKPNSRVVDPKNWVDKKAPDGINIIAQMEGQATPAQYPGLRPELPENEIQLFNLRKDPTESNDLSEDMPEKVEELLKDYTVFKESLKK